MDKTDVRRTGRTLYWICFAVVLSSACRSPAPLNRPLEAPGSYRIGDEMTLASPERSGRILLAITFSGGGTRAAALSYGVLRELKETRIRLDGRSRPLLDEIDLISSVSGGSFTAAYFGLHGVMRSRGSRREWNVGRADALGRAPPRRPCGLRDTRGTGGCRYR
jgi:hypothetical protein